MVKLAPLYDAAAVGLKTTSILQEPFAAAPVVTHVLVVVVDSEYAAEEKVRLVIGSIVVEESAFTISVSGPAVTLTKTWPKANGPPVTVAVCPQAATAAKRRTPAIRAGTLRIEF
jgi:hypothetical protein